MGILSKGLSIGVMIGEICRGILSNYSNNHVDEETGIRMMDSNLKVDDVKFCLTNSSGEDEICAFNISTSSDKLIQFPNDTAGNCLCYDLPKMRAVSIQNAVRKAASPDTMLNVCTTIDSKANAENGDLPQVTFRIQDLLIGDGSNYINVYGYKISATIDSIIISSLTPVLKLTFVSFTSKEGINLTLNQVLNPICRSLSGDSGPSEYHFNIPFENYSFRQNDLLSGQITITIAAAYQNASNAKASRVFHPAEERYFKKIGLIR